jgi:hypothetical protein
MLTLVARVPFVERIAAAATRFHHQFAVFHVSVIGTESTRFWVL